jgi:hypothetical protein
VSDAMRVDILSAATPLDVTPVATETRSKTKPRALTEADAVEIWISRWLRSRPIDIMQRYGCDGRRLYDIWWGKAFPGSRSRAKQAFIERYPGAAETTVFGYRRIPRGGIDPRQTTLFDLMR